MKSTESNKIYYWHAHVYFDEGNMVVARMFYEKIVAEIPQKVQVGRFHERCVGPHPKWSFQISISNHEFYQVFEWLINNHDVLDIFIHPNTGNEMRDHSHGAVWIGKSHQLDFSKLD